MPTITTQTIDGYAHCRDSECLGNEQQPVKVIREQADVYYKEWDPDGVPGVMHSTVRVRFVDEADIPCPHCGETREATDQKRPKYPVMTSPFGPTTTDQKFLLKLKQMGMISEPGSKAGANAELEALRLELAELRGELRGQRRGPGRPRKDETA